MNHDELMKAKAAKDPEYRKLYEEMLPLFDFTVELIGRRNKAGLTQMQLAKKLGTTEAIVSQLEGGERKPSGDMLMKLSKLFSISFVITDGDIKIKDSQAA